MAKKSKPIPANGIKRVRVNEELSRKLTSSLVTMRPLYTYRVRVKIYVNGVYEIVDYYVEAPTQCSATRYTAIRDEVEDIIIVELWNKSLPKPLTFTTVEDCP
jgi:hypothetical protein